MQSSINHAGFFVFFSVFAINRFLVEIHYSSRLSSGNMKWPLNEFVGVCFFFLENLLSSF